MDTVDGFQVTQNPLTDLAVVIERHWQTHRPQMWAGLEAAGIAHQMAGNAAELTRGAVMDLMDHGLGIYDAWEATREIWAILPAEDDGTEGDLIPIDPTEDDFDDGLEAPDADILEGLSTGEYGEVFAPPLCSMEPDEALVEFKTVIEQRGEIWEEPQGEDRQLIINMALIYCHQKALVAAVAGTLDTPDAKVIFNAVNAGYPLSIRPLGLENLTFETFVPILSLLDVARSVWQFGLVDHGKHMVFTLSSDQAVAYAQRLYVEWSCQEGGV